MQGRFGKVVLVVLGVILMLVFILPSSLPQLTGGDPVIATVGEQEIRRADWLAVANQYAYAGNSIVVTGGGAQGQPPQNVPLPNLLFGQFADRLDRDPELFYVLLSEARANGIELPPAQVEENLTQLQANVWIEDNSAPDRRRLVAFSDVTGQQLRGQVIAAAAPLFDVRQSMNHFMDYARVSSPLVDYFLALQGQRVDLRTVVFDARDHLSSVETPTEPAVAEHFEMYKDNEAGATTPENPFGFGYKLPDRVKFQYVMVPYATIERKVTDELLAMSLRDREQELYRYWNENRARFPVPPGSPATQPASRPATQPATQPSTQPALPPPPPQDALPEANQAAAQPSTQPTTAPATQPSGVELLLAEQNPQVNAFLDEQTQRVAGQSEEANWRAFVAVHDSVARRVVNARVNDLRGRIGKRLRDTIMPDYRAYDLARPSSGASTTQPSAPAPTTAGNTRVGVPFDDPAYFERVADRLAEEFGVRPTVATYQAQFFDRDALQETEQVGTIAEAALMQMGAMFPDYILGGTLPLLEPAEAELLEQNNLGLSLLEPSQALLDLVGNDYVFRVIEAAPAAPAGSVEVVAEQVREDLRRQAAYELALAEARQFAEAARATSLDEAAAAVARTIHDPEPFVPLSGLLDAQALGATDDDDTISAAARSDLAESIYQMLARGQGDRPIDVLTMRPAFRAIVAELQGLEADWSDPVMLAFQREQLRSQIGQQAVSSSAPLNEFFDYQRAAAAAGYERKEAREEQAEQAER